MDCAREAVMKAFPHEPHNRPHSEHQPPKTHHSLVLVLVILVLALAVGFVLLQFVLG